MIREKDKVREQEKVRKQEKVRAQLKGKVKEVLTARQLFNPMLFLMHNDVFCYNEHTNQTIDAQEKSRNQGC